MYITRPAIEVYMPDGTTETLGSDVIVQKSISFRETMVNGLDISASCVSLQVKPCQEVKDILADNSPTLPCTLYNNYTSSTSKGTAVFTGRMNGSFSYRVSRSGEETFSINIEDESYRLDASYGASAYLSGTASSIIALLIEKAGLSLQSNPPAISTQVERAVERDDTLRELLSSLCIEVGYAYHISNGTVYLKALDASTPTATVTDAHLSGFELNREVRQYKDVTVSFSQYETASVMIYSDITGQDATHLCNISIPSGGTYPSESEAGYTGGGTKVEAVDSASGREIIAILSNPTVDMTASSTGVTASITREGTSGRDLFVKVSNSTSLAQQVTKLNATASCRVKVSDGKIRSYATSEATMPLDRDALWLHTRATAENFAGFLKNYYSYANYRYTFESDVEYALGQVVTLSDSSISGSSQVVYIEARETTDIGASASSGQRYRYTAHSTSPFSTVTTYSDTYRKTSGSRRGLDGKNGATVEIEYALGDSLTEHPTTGWSTTQPTPTASLPYVWRRERTVTED